MVSVSDMCRFVCCLAPLQEVSGLLGGWPECTYLSVLAYAILFYSRVEFDIRPVYNFVKRKVPNGTQLFSSKAFTEERQQRIFCEPTERMLAHVTTHRDKRQVWLTGRCISHRQGEGEWLLRCAWERYEDEACFMSLAKFLHQVLLL